MSAIETATIGAGAVALDAKAIAVSASSIALSGSIFGMQYEALIAALAGSLFALAFSTAQLARWRLIVWMVTGTMIAAYGAPILASIAVTTYPSLHALMSEVRGFCAATLGFSMKVILPALSRKAESVVSQTGGQS